jgi:hypothetical protein
MTDALTTASHQSGEASTEGQLNTKEWGKLVWAVPLPHTPLQAQSTNFLNRLHMLTYYERSYILFPVAVSIASVYGLIYMTHKFVRVKELTDKVRIRLLRMNLFTPVIKW